jgi:hypothetical protein
VRRVPVFPSILPPNAVVAEKVGRGQRYFIALTQGKYAEVSREDWHRLKDYNWFVQEGYAARKEWNWERMRYDLIYMHRQIMQTPPFLEVDHKNRNRLDNRRRNLVNTTHYGNMQNKGPSSEWRTQMQERIAKRAMRRQAKRYFNG